MKNAKMSLSYKELMILDHAIRCYQKRDNKMKNDEEAEERLLDRVNRNIKCIKVVGKYGER